MSHQIFNRVRGIQSISAKPSDGMVKRSRLMDLRAHFLQGPTQQDRHVSVISLRFGCDICIYRSRGVVDGGDVADPLEGGAAGGFCHVGDVAHRLLDLVEVGVAVDVIVDAGAEDGGGGGDVGEHGGEVFERCTGVAKIG